MNSYQLQIRIRYKDGILDPQAEAIEAALRSLKFENLKKVECDKIFLLEVEALDRDSAETLGKDMAEQLLTNLVMEDYSVEVKSL